MDIKLLSWNIWGGIFLPEVTEFLKSANADIIALQEVEETDEFVNTASILSETLDYEFVYARSMQYTFRDKTAFRGNAILSRLHIAGSRSHELSHENPRTAMLADIAVNDTVIHAASVHLIHSEEQPSPLQEEQVRTLLSVIPKEKMIVMGDFNAIPESSAVSLMGHGFREADPGMHPTWCLYPEGPETRMPGRVNTKIDYIFTSPDMKIHDFSVGSSDGSDHLPILARLQVI